MLASESGALNRPDDRAAEADPLDLVENWLAAATEISWGSNADDGSWANMPRRYLEAVAAEARRSREHSVGGQPLSVELRAVINRVLRAYETPIPPATLLNSDLWPALAELRREVDAQIAREHPLYHGEGVEHGNGMPLAEAWKQAASAFSDQVAMLAEALKPFHYENCGLLDAVNRRPCDCGKAG